MRKLVFWAAVVSVLLASGVRPARAEPDFGQGSPIPDAPPQLAPPGPNVFGLDGADPGFMPSLPGAPGQSAAPGLRAAPRPADKAEAKTRPTRKEMLDALFGRLAKTTDPSEAQGIATVIQHEWLRSGSDTADLLMTRALSAMGGERRDVAQALLDKIIQLQPDWAEAWNRRATLRFLANDDSGSMEDISHVLNLEPRHFGALSGMGFILQRHGMGKQALTALRRALAIYPEDQDIRKVVDQLTPEVEGRDL